MTDFSYFETIFTQQVLSRSDQKYCPVNSLPNDIQTIQYKLLASTVVQASAASQKLAAGKNDARCLKAYYCGLIDNLELNGFSFVHDDMGYIAIFSGAAYLMHDLFSRMLSHPNVFPEYGNSRAEQVKVFHSEGTATHFSEFTSGHSVEERLQEVVPACPHRRQLAEYFASTSMAFLIRHEIGHIRFGHCDYVEAAYHLPFVLEANSTDGGLDNLAWHVLEMEADDFALSTMLDELTLLRPDLTLLPHELMVLPYVPEMTFQVASHRMLFRWLFSVLSLFWVLGLDVDEDQMAKYGHPFPVQRMWQLQMRARLFLAERHPDFVSEFDKVFNPTLNSVCHAFGCIGDRVPTRADGPLIIPAAGEDGVIHKHFRKLIAHWKLMRPQLEKFRYSVSFADPLSSR